MYPNKQFPEEIRARLNTEWGAWRSAVSTTIARILSETNENISAEKVQAQGLGQVVEDGSNAGYNTDVMTEALMDLDIENGRDLAELICHAPTAERACHPHTS